MDCSWSTFLSLMGFPSLFATFIGVLAIRLRTTIKSTNAIKLGMQALLRDRLYKIYDKCTAKGYATLYERENFENLYLQYHSLGSNGVMDDIRTKFLALEVEDDVL